MQSRQLGAGAPKVGALGLGTMGIGGAYGRCDEPAALATVHLALDLGVNLLDTADFYGAGSSERVLGQVLATRRDEAVVASKTGMRLEPGGPVPDGRPEFITGQVEGSLRRLGIDQLDLYYLARIDPAVPVEESVGALAELVQAGKVGAIGLCEASSATIRRAAAIHPLAAVQTEYSLWERHVENDVLAVTAELGIALVAYRPLGSGFLSGRLTMDRLDSTDLRRHDPRLQEANLLQNMRLISPLEELAQAHELTPAQLALCWLLAQAPHVIPIPGTKRTRYLRQNAAATECQLSQPSLAEVGAAVGAAHGPRYAPGLLATIDAG